MPLTGGHPMRMRNLLSLLIGAMGLMLVALAFLPLLGWANWFILPMAIIGLGIGATSNRTAGRNLNLVVILIGVLRLSLGGGIF